MPRDEAPDTSVFIHVFHDPRRDADLFERLIMSRTWLSSVVATELYAGSRGREEGRGLHRLVGVMGRAGRLLTPLHDEWVVAGQLLARATRLYGQFRPRDHLADILITLSAARLKGTVVTANVAHFERWVALAHDSGHDVTVTPFMPSPRQ